MTLVKWEKNGPWGLPLPHPRSQAVPTLVRPAHLQAEAQGTGPGGLMVREVTVVAEALAGRVVWCSLNREPVPTGEGRETPGLVKTRQSRWLLPSQILSNRCRLTLCLSTRAILYRTLQLSDSKGKAVL